jgi:hypothetical protein
VKVGLARRMMVPVSLGFPSSKLWAPGAEQIPMPAFILLPNSAITAGSGFSFFLVLFGVALPLFVVSHRASQKRARLARAQRSLLHLSTLRN